MSSSAELSLIWNRILSASISSSENLHYGRYQHLQSDYSAANLYGSALLACGVEGKAETQKGGQGRCDSQQAWGVAAQCAYTGDSAQRTCDDVSHARLVIGSYHIAVNDTTTINELITAAALLPAT